MPASNHRTSIEQLVEVVLNGPGDTAPAELRGLAARVLEFQSRTAKVVVLGGGTGMSTVVGGNSGMPDWSERPFVGLKEEFDELHVVVCTTDDGGSTGELLKHLPMIGIGDLRKSCISLVRAENLQKTYDLDRAGVERLVAVIAQIFNYRFDAEHPDARVLVDPLLAASEALRDACPAALASSLRSLGAYVAPGGSGPSLDVAGNCLGNLLLTAAVFRAASGRTDTWPDLEQIQVGVEEVARLVGGAPGRLHPATSTPGQLSFRYANGVEVYGQAKAALARRGFPVEGVRAEFAAAPVVSEALCRTIAEADLIILAPGSVYSSMIPVLQLDEIVSAIRANERALKILGANFWIQQGETDISLRHEGRGFWVSELIEAYDRNVPGGVDRLFEYVLCANLEHMPGHILRNYALEGKRGIHLDRSRVEAMGLRPVEATLFSPDHLSRPGVIHHDAGNFALAVRTLWFAREHLEPAPEAAGKTKAKTRPQERKNPRHGVPLCDYRASVARVLHTKRFEPQALEGVMLELAWENRDIRPAHFECCQGVQMIPAKRWGRSTEWDNVLGYFDAEDGFIKVHEQLVMDPARLCENLLVGLGESLLGRYIERRGWLEDSRLEGNGGRCYEVKLRPASERRCFLSDVDLRTYLRLARMTQDREQPDIYRIILNNDEGFLPSGLLFGLLYAWYINNAYGGVMDYEMSLLGWPAESLMPQHVQERTRKQALLAFFREKVFGH